MLGQPNKICVCDASPELVNKQNAFKILKYGCNDLLGKKLRFCSIERIVNLFSQCKFLCQSYVKVFLRTVLYAFSTFLWVKGVSLSWKEISPLSNAKKRDILHT